MISFGLGFLLGGMSGVLITTLCVISSRNDWNIKSNKEESNE